MFAIFKAYRRWVDEQGKEEKQLPGLDFSHNQLFFINFAQVRLYNFVLMLYSPVNIFSVVWGRFSVFNQRYAGDKMSCLDMVQTDGHMLFFRSTVTTISYFLILMYCNPCNAMGWFVVLVCGSYCSYPLVFCSCIVCQI